MATRNICATLSVIVILFCSVSLVTCVPTLENAPQNKTVVDGMRTSFICDVNDNNEDTIFWTFSTEPGIRKYITSNAYIYPYTDRINSNYQIDVDQQRQTYELILHSPNKTIDEGMYECGYEYGPNRRYAALAMASLTIQSFSDSHSCQYNRLPISDEARTQEIEVVCSCTHDESGTARFKNNGQVIEADLQYSNRIVSRFASPDIPHITCLVGGVDGQDDAKEIDCTIDAGSIGEGHGIVRVDPFINEKTAGSNATFTCTSPDLELKSSMTWNVADGGTMENRGRIVENQNRMTILNVTVGDEAMVVECRVSTGENTAVSSLATLRIVEPTTSPNRRPPGDSQRNKTTYAPKTSQISTTSTQSAIRSGQNITGIIVAIVILLIFIVSLTIFIIVMVIKRRRKTKINKTKLNKKKIIKRRQISAKGVSNSTANQALYDSIEPVPHIRPTGSSQLYALSFKDKKTKTLRSGEILVTDTNFGNLESSLTVSSGLLNIQPSSSNEQVYAEAEDITTLGKTTNGGALKSQAYSAKSASMPVLDVNEYECISSGNISAETKAKTLSALTVSPMTVRRSDRVWRSQRMTKYVLDNPPKARHALSVRKPAPQAPNISNDYTKMTIGKNEAVCVEPALQDRTNEHSKPTEPGSRRDPEGHDYADISQRDRKSSTQHDEEVVVDTYLSNLPGPFSDPMRTNMSRSNKTTTVYRETAIREPPPKPTRGKCHSELMGHTYNAISEYEIMKEQIKEDDNDSHENETDCDGDAGSPPKMDNKPRGTVSGQRPAPLRGVTCPYGTVDVSEHARVKKDVVSEAGSNDYELVGENNLDQKAVPQSPCYAAIEDVMYETVNHSLE